MTSDSVSQDWQASSGEVQEAEQAMDEVKSDGGEEMCGLQDAAEEQRSKHPPGLSSQAMALEPTIVGEVRALKSFELESERVVCILGRVKRAE